MRPERRNAVKVLLFFDIGGSMDWHIEQVEELFSAAKAEFKHMEHFYFHNCLYEGVWKDNRRRHDEQIADLGRPPHLSVTTTSVIFVGDASMSPYEIAMPGGSVEHRNEEAGAGLARARARALSRTPSGSTPCSRAWGYTQSIRWCASCSPAACSR